VIRVFIVAASSLARAGLQSLFGTRDVEVTGSAPNFESLAGQWPDGEADIVLVDAAGEQLEGVLDSLAASQIASEAAIVVLSDHTEPRLLPKRCERASALCCQAIYHQTNSSPPSKPLRRD